jgi:hypothetical protein
VAKSFLLKANCPLLLQGEASGHSRYRRTSVGRRKASRPSGFSSPARPSGQAGSPTPNWAPQARYLPCVCRRVCGSGSELPPPPPPRPTPRPFPGLAPARRPRPPRPGAALFTVSPTELGFTPLILLRAAAASAPPLLLSWRWRWRWRAVLQVQVTVCRVQVLSDRRG